jgi:hypothetical protein
MEVIVGSHYSKMILDTIAFHTINAFAISLAALLISHVTWSEEHLWNIGVFQTVQLSGLQIADDLICLTNITDIVHQASAVCLYVHFSCSIRSKIQF